MAEATQEKGKGTETKDLEQIPFKTMEVELPNGETRRKRFRKFPPIAAVVTVHKDGRNGLFRWTSSESSVKSMVTAAKKAEDVVDVVVIDGKDMKFLGEDLPPAPKAEKEAKTEKKSAKKSNEKKAPAKKAKKPAKIETSGEVFKNKKAAGMAAQALGLKKTAVKKVKGGWQVKAA